MGTWGKTAFEDDTALAFYDEFCESEQSMKDLETTYHTTKPIVTVSESPTPALPLKPAKFKSSKP